MTDWNWYFFVGHFLPIYSPKNLKNQNFEKNEKNCWRYEQLTHVHQKSRSYVVWFLRYGAWQTEFFIILDRFLPFYPLTTQTIKILKKTKNRPGDTVILHMCTINDHHMMYGSWYLREREGGVEMVIFKFKRSPFNLLLMP